MPTIVVCFGKGTFSEYCCEAICGNSDYEKDPRPWGVFVVGIALPGGHIEKEEVVRL